MNYLIFFIISIQSFIIFKLLVESIRKNQLFSLPSVLGISCYMYITVPTIIFTCLEKTLINGAVIFIPREPLIISAIFGLIFIIFLRRLPSINMRMKFNDTLWIKILFILITGVNTYYFLKFLVYFDFKEAFNYIQDQKFSFIRDIAYQNLVKNNIKFGYVLGAFQLSLFGFLWLQNNVKKFFLTLAILPLILMNIFSLSRFSIASFLIVIFFCLEQKYNLKKFFLIPLALFILLFFARPLIFYFTDTGYSNWINFNFNLTNSGLESLGEFYNTYGTFIMVYSIEEARFSLNEILTIIFSQIFIPPGFTNLFYQFIDMQYPIFRITELIMQDYGTHPAHSSLVDFYTFGLFSIPFFILYFLLISYVSKNVTNEKKVVYFYLLSVFFLPFRGSLTFSVIRIIWIILGLYIFHYLINKIIYLISRIKKL